MKFKSFTQRALRLVYLLLGTVSLASFAVPSQAQETSIGVQLDWIIQGTHSPFLVAQERGYFKEEGLRVKIDPGSGGTGTAVNVASGAYDFGFVDLATMVVFNFQNPASPLVSVYMSFDETPQAIVTLKDKGINSPADLDGKTLLGAPGNAGYDTMPILLEASGAKDVNITWVPVAGSLFGAMMKRGEADGIAGFINAQIPALMVAGFERDQITAIRYADFGASMYGLSLVTTKKFADENPEVVRGMVRALNRGTIDTIRNPEEALKILADNIPLTDIDIERVRLEIATTLMYTDRTKENGLSTVETDRLQRSIDMISAAYGLTSEMEPGAVFDPAFLPPAAERMVEPK